MKIDKFNESYRGDKIIKLYNSGMLHDYYQNKDEYKVKIEEFKKLSDESRKDILKLINEYVEFNKDYFDKKYSFYRDIEDFTFYVDEESKTPKMSLRPKYYNTCWLKYDDIEGLLKFLDDPDIYRNMKKYNI